MLAFVFMTVLGAFPQQAQAQPSEHSRTFKVSPLQKGDFLLLRGQPEEALKVFQQLWQKEPDNAYAVRGMVRAWQALGQLSQGAGFFEASLQRDPQSPNAVYALGYIDYLQSRYESSRDRLQDALRQNPNHGLALNALAAALTELKDYEGALEKVRQAIEADPDELMFYRNLKMIYVRSGQTDKFEEEYRGLLARGETVRSKNFGLILAQLKRQASFKLYSEGKIDETLDAIREMLKIYKEIDHQPGIVAGLFSLAVLYEERGEMDRALENYREVIKINPQHIQAREKVRLLDPKID